jgi:hypothetical protein
MKNSCRNGTLRTKPSPAHIAARMPAFARLIGREISARTVRATTERVITEAVRVVSILEAPTNLGYALMAITALR